MKNITNEIRDALTPEEIERRRQITVMGEKMEMPKKLFDQMFGFLSFYEADDVQDIVNSYDMLCTKTKMPASSFFFNMKVMMKTLRNKNYIKQSKRLNAEFGGVLCELIGEDTKIMDLFTNKIGKPNQVYVHDVKLENFKHVRNELISAYIFDIRDRKNKTIEGVFVYEMFTDNAFSTSDERIINKKNMIDMARTAHPGDTFVIQGTLLDEHYTDKNYQRQPRKKRMNVLRITNGGINKGLPLPVITVR